MFFFTWLPTVVALPLLLIARREGEFSTVGMIVAGSWFVVAFGLQYFGRTPLMSALGLALQAALAVFLLIRMRLR